MKKVAYSLFVLVSFFNSLDAQKSITPASSWPHVIPGRVRDADNKDLFIMTLGDVKTSLADGVFDPAIDEMRLDNGIIIHNYYRDSLHIRFYKPIDKTIFPLPPSGFCTWYYYYQDVNENEVKRNAKWIADNLKDYGAQYVQIDDGWQGETKEGRHGSRDWTTIDRAFPGGMAKLATYIKSLGLIPGIWIAPHGQSNEDIVSNSKAIFMLMPDGTSASSTWEGRYLVDPTTDETHVYLRNLFAKMVDWGYDYFKIDGQPIVVDEYRSKQSFMKKPGGDGEILYRKTIETIRSAIGPNRYLLGCWGIPLEGVGLMNGTRTGGDVVLGWSGFGVALRATMEYYFMHNVVWYTDPDVMLVRLPLTLDQARVWATLQGLTGQALLSSDRLMDLPENRVELLRRVYPAADIRPLDLFPSERNKRIWDLKISHLGRNYDVVGVFNFGESKQDQVFLNWKELGLPENRPVHVFDFWNKEYLGEWDAGMAVDLSPTSCRVLTLTPGSDQIQLISTSRHITQGWIELVELKNNAEKNTLGGKSKLVKNDPYELQFAFPRGENFSVKKATARTSSGPLAVKVSDHQGWATIQFTSPKTTEVIWEVQFKSTDSYNYAVRAPGGIQIERVGLDGVIVKWGAQYYLNAGYQVYLDGKTMGYSQSTNFPIRGLDPSRTYTVDVRTVWDDGTVNQRTEGAAPNQRSPEVRFSLNSMLPDELMLNSLEPVRPSFGSRINSAGRTLTAGGKRYENGITARPNSEIEFDIKGMFSSFLAAVALDGENRSDTTTVEFIASGDGEELWRSGPMKKGDGIKPVSCALKDVHRLLLRVTGPNVRFSRDQADWIEPRLVKGGK